MVKTTVYALRCSKCGDVMFSRARHDYRSCTCGSLSVDGGFDYQRIAWDPKFINIDSIQTLELELPISKTEIYEDWNKSVDRWGKNYYYDIQKFVTKVITPEVKDKQ